MFIIGLVSLLYCCMVFVCIIIVLYYQAGENSHATIWFLRCLHDYDMQNYVHLNKAKHFFVLGNVFIISNPLIVTYNDII